MDFPATPAQKRRAIADIEEIQERRAGQMTAMVNAALEGVEGVKLYKVEKGLGVYQGSNGEVIEYTFNVQLDVDEGKEEEAVRAMAMVAQISSQDSFIVNYPDGQTENGEPHRQVRVKLQNPLSLEDQAALSLKFSMEGLGLTITDSEINTSYFPEYEIENWDELPEEEKRNVEKEFVYKVYNLLNSFNNGNAETSIRIEGISGAALLIEGMGRDTQVLGKFGDSSTGLAHAVIETRQNYSDYNEGRQDGDKRDYSEFINRRTGEAENEADDLSVQAEAINNRLASIQQAYNEAEVDNSIFDSELPEGDKPLGDDVAQQKKYADIDLFADDVVVIFNPRGDYYLARKNEDGSFTTIDGQTKKGDFRVIEKKVVYRGDAPYIVLSTASWDMLSAGRNGYKEGKLKVFNTVTGEVESVPREELRKDELDKKGNPTGSRVAVWKNPEDENEYLQLKKKAKTLDDILNFVVLRRSTKDKKQIVLTLRDVLRYSSMQNDELQYAAKDKKIDRMIRHILEDMGMEVTDISAKVDDTSQSLMAGKSAEYLAIEADLKENLKKAVYVWNQVKGVAKENQLRDNMKELNPLIKQWVKLVDYMHCYG